MSTTGWPYHIHEFRIEFDLTVSIFGNICFLSGKQQTAWLNTRVIFVAIFTREDESYLPSQLHNTIYNKSIEWISGTVKFDIKNIEQNVVRE